MSVWEEYLNVTLFLFLHQIEQQYPEAFEVWIQLDRLFFLLLTYKLEQELQALLVELGLGL